MIDNKDRPRDPVTGRFEDAGQTEFTPELGDVICAEIIDGKSLRSICKMEGMPAKRTVMYWLRKYPQFKSMYDLACIERSEAYAEEIVDIADDGSNDWMEVETKSGNVITVVDHEHIQRSKLRVEARKWICSKMKPRKYGEKIELEHTGSLDWAEQLQKSRERAAEPTPERPKQH